MAVLAKSLIGLRAAFDTAFPDRDRATDGWIGDESHQGHVSGHNPDDTAGSLAESSDADTVAEVRAIDVDADLRASVSMMDVVMAILATPADRDRLRYIIHNRVIWSKSNGWAPRIYTGASPHTGHAHFSSDPSADESTAPWTSVLTIGDDMQLTDRVPAAATDDNEGRNVDQVLGDVWRFAHIDGRAELAQLRAAVDELRAKLDALDGEPVPVVVLDPADRDAIVAQLVAAMNRPLIVDLAGRVHLGDELVGP